MVGIIDVRNVLNAAEHSRHPGIVCHRLLSYLVSCKNPHGLPEYSLILSVCLLRHALHKAEAIQTNKEDQRYLCKTIMQIAEILVVSISFMIWFEHMEQSYVSYIFLMCYF